MSSHARSPPHGGGEPGCCKGGDGTSPLLASVSIEATAGEEGKLFGSVGTRDISEAITAAGVEIDKSEVRLPEGVIRELGEYEVMLQLHGNVAASIAVAVVAA